jgi:hypothetical protein
MFLYFHLQPFQIDAELLCTYSDFLRRSFKSAQRIRNYLNGVKVLFLLLGLNIEMFRSYVLKLTFKNTISELYSFGPFKPYNQISRAHGNISSTQLSGAIKLLNRSIPLLTFPVSKFCPVQAFKVMYSMNPCSSSSSAFSIN